MKKITLFTLLLFTFLLPFSSQAQKTTKLLKGKLYEAAIDKKDHDVYTYLLEANQYLFGVVQQKGIDLKVETYGPDGTKIKEFDSPNGTNGPEYFTIENEKAGEYRIEVKPLNEEGRVVESGEYSLKILKIERKATTNEGKVAQLFAAYDRLDSPGASVAVVKDGKVVYKDGFGSANLEYDIPNTPSTVFHIASISKQFTTFAIAQLVDKGKISLDDDIRTYLPEVPDFGEKITIRHLAHHTSGLRDQWNLLALAGWRLDDVITTEHVLKLVANQKELNYKPGEEFLYCNTGFTLMGEIVARVTEQTFAEYCAKNIFEPLKMSNTLFYDDHEKIVKNRAYSYGTNEKGFRKSVLSYANAGATSLFTTVEDLSKWAMNFENTKVGNANIMKMMHTKGVLNNGEEISYALGQFMDEYKGLNRIQHGGADAGYRTFLGRFPNQKFSVVVFSNLGNFNPSGMAAKIADIYLADEIKAAKKPEKIAEKEAIKTKALAATKVEVSETTLNSYAGKYELQPGFIITISTENGELKVQATGQGGFIMTAIAENKFEFKDAGIVIAFDKNDKGVIHQLTLNQGGRESKAPRLADFDAKSIDLSMFTGKYYSDELSTFYTLLVEDGALIARHARHEDIQLELVKKDFFGGNKWFFGLLEIIRSDIGVITGCKVSSGRVRGVWFEKQ